MLIWSQVQIAVTIYIAILVPEDQRKDTIADEQYSLRQVFLVLGDIVKNKNLQIYFAFRCVLVSTLMINSNLGSVYLTNDVKYHIY